MPTINATLINLFHVCPRECWLHAQGIRMEHTSDIVYEGKLIGENTYGERAERDTQLELFLPDDGTGGSASAKIDFFDTKTRTVHETKKSDRQAAAQVAQVKFYLWMLHRAAGIEGATGILEYPKTRERTAVPALDEAEFRAVEGWLRDIRALLAEDRAPALVRKKVCDSCSYYEYCYAGETE